MSELSAIITLACTGTTAADLSRFVARCDELRLADDLELLDGIAPGLTPAPELRPYPQDLTLGSLRVWVRELVALGAPELVVPGAADVGVDLPVSLVELAECGEHVDGYPATVTVYLDERCAGHGQ